MESSVGHETRERILEVAEACLSESGYHGTRLHQIAERVGIQKASLFHYFSSKEGLYRAVIDNVFREMEDTILEVLKVEAAPPQKIRLLIEAYIDLVAEHPNRSRIFLRQSLGDAPVGYPTADSQRWLETIITFVEQAQERRQLPMVDACTLILSLMGGVMFLYTSAPAVAPSRMGDTASPAATKRIKQQMMDIVDRFLIAPLSAATDDELGAVAQTSGSPA